MVFQISFSLLNHVDVRWVHHCLINRSVMSDVGRGSVGVYQSVTWNPMRLNGHLHVLVGGCWGLGSLSSTLHIIMNYLGK